jgi:rod shape-determining protein MreD
MRDEDEQPRRLEERLFREVVLAISLATVAMIQVTLLPAPVGFPPALLLVIIVCRVLLGWRLPQPNNAVTRAIRWAFYGGLALDVLAATPLGVHALALTLAATVVAGLTRRFSVDGPLLVLTTMVPAVVIYELVLLFHFWITSTFTEWRTYLIVVLLPSLLMALILTLPTFWLMQWTAQRR